MNKILLAGAAVLFGTAAYAQTAIDAYRLSQPDLKGTARYMSMAGAFGALGGDLSVLSHNPGGIGIYRNSEVGFTLDLDLQNSESSSPGDFKNSIDQTKFLLNNIGFVWTLKLPSSSCPNINFGFTYNKTASFNRRYRGSMALSSSLSNYIAAFTTYGGYQEGQLIGDSYNNYDPYNPPASDDAAPWLSILGYDGYLMSIRNYNGSTGAPNYMGQWGNGTYGMGYFDVQESGGVDSYNIAVGGNINNVFFWGMDFDITHLNYKLTPQWTERLENALVGDDNGMISSMSAAWTLSNYYNCSGTGFNYKLGFIVKPIQEFRIGFAFETPTWYGLTETFSGDLAGIYNGKRPFSVTTNDGDLGITNVNFRTPWKINASAAAVLFNRLIISAEYEWTQYKKMKYSAPSPWNDGWNYPWDDGWDYPWDYPWDYYPAKAYDNYYISNDPYYYANSDISEIYCNTNTLRLGAELRVLPQLSLRAGYSYVSSPVNQKAQNNWTDTSGTIPNYRFDNTTNYVTCGLGWRIQSFYIDMAYVYKHLTSEFHPFSPWYPASNEPAETFVPVQKSSLSLNNSQIVLSAGFKF